MQAVFWISLSLLFYTYLGYGLLLLLLNFLRRKKKPNVETFLPPLTVVIPAYNEAAVIRQKLQNTLALDYPAGKLSLVVITDGSTDATPDIVSNFSGVLLLHRAERRGKSAALNRAVQAVETPFVVFTDANAMVHPQSLRRMMRHFADAGVGGVSGEKRIGLHDASAVGFGERLYWQYESILKKANADFYTLVGAAGELFAMRTSLFEPLEEDVVLDDFVLSARVCLQGYRFLYEAGAGSVESSSASFGDERKRKVRISAGCYQALVRLPQLLNPFRNFRLAFQYGSHRVLRWVVCPFTLPLLLLSNAVLAANGAVFYRWLFWAQLAFYGLALLGRLFSGGGKLCRLLLVPHYFLFMVASQYAGFLRFVRRRQPAVWEKLPRSPVPQKP